MDLEIQDNYFVKYNIKPQKENIYNRLLPYADDLDDESCKLFADIKSNLIKSVLAREMRPGCALWTSRLNKYIKIYGLKFSKEDHIALIKLFYQLMIIPDLEPTRIHKCASTLIQLLKKKYLLTRDDLQLDWRPLYDLCVKTIMKSNTEIGMYRYSSSFENTIETVIHAAKVYFPASATQEILDEFRPYICPFNVTDMSHAIEYFNLLLPQHVKPSEASISYNLWFDELMTLWNDCLETCAWENHMMAIMTKLASRNMGYIDWGPHIPHMFVRFQRSFQLPVNFKQKQIGRQHKIDIRNMAIWIVSILNGDNNIAFSHFQKFMQSLESYYYPANVGRWSPKIRELLKHLSFNFVQRVHYERYKMPSWEFQVPDHFKLTDADIDRFVNIMKPCAEQAMFSRTNSHEITLTLQYLSSLRPNIIIPMTLEKLYASMNSLTEPHKLTSSMMAVIAVGRYMVQGARYEYPEGPTHVIPLLIELLPGIDPNDIRKSFVTFNFIVHFVNMIPLVNSSEASKYYELTEEEHIICEATAMFEDFVLQFFDKIFIWMESSALDFIRMEQLTNSDSKNSSEALSESAIASLIGVILYQCSPEIFKSALKKLYNFVIDKIMEVHVSGKLIAVTCHAFAKVNPMETLKLFVPYLCDRIEQLLSENPNITNEEHVDDELLYNLLILSEIVDGRSELLIYIPRLKKILDKTLHMTCLKASQFAARILEVIMYSLTSNQSTEVRSSSVDYSTHVKDFLPIREWGKAENIKDLKISWYVPKDKEVEAVQSLLNTYLIPELQKLENHSSGQNMLSRRELKQTLKIVTATLSCHPLLPIWDEPMYQLIDSVLEPWVFNLKVSSGNHIMTMPDGTNVRKTVVDVLHNLQAKLLEVDEGDTQSILHIVNIYNIMLFNKSRGHDFEFHWKSFHMTKKLLEDRLHQKKLHLRHVLINRVLLQQEFRIESRNCSFTKTHRQILLDLFELSVSRYSKNRMVAQCKLYNIISTFPYSYNVLTESIKMILQLDPKKYHEQFKGCLYILLGPRNSPIIARHDWKFIMELWPLIVKSEPSEKPSIINLITGLTDIVNKFFPTIAIKLIIPEAALAAAYNLCQNVPICDLSNFQTVIDQGEMYLSKKSTERRQAYDTIISALLDALESGNLHWRYHFMTLNLIKTLVHFEVPYHERIVKYFLQALISDSIIVRKAAIKVMVFILIQNKPKFKKIELDPFKFSNVARSRHSLRPGIREDNKWLLYNRNSLPKTAEKWDEPRYIHNQYTGYYQWPKTLKVYDSPSKQETPCKRMDKLTEKEQYIYDFFSSDEKMSVLIKYLSMEEKKGRDQFNSYRLFMFKYLFKMFEDRLLPTFIPHLQRLLDGKVESNQRCAAEIISGIIRGSKHWEFSKSQNLWEVLIPFIEKAITNMCTETQPDWALCISMGLESRDPNKCYWLLEYLLDDPLKEHTSFIACTRLYLLSNAVSQQTWRNSEIGVRLMEYLQPHLTHEFQNIRERISACITLILCKDTIVPHGSDIKVTSTQELFKQVMPKLNGLYNNTLAKIDNSHDINQIFTEEQDKESTIRLYKVVTKFAAASLTRVNYAARPEYFELLPLSALLQSNEVDEELSTLATNLLVVLAQTMTLSDYIPHILVAIKKVANCPSWSARAVIAEFLPVFIFYNMATINNKKEWVQEIQSIVLGLMEDTQHEVREAAVKILSGLLHCQFILDPKQLLETFKHMARNKAKGKSEGALNGLRFKHAGVLGLCAFIEAHPYDVPDFIPDIFSQLKARMNDLPPIPATIRKTLGNFKRTHHGNWDIHKLKFTEDELLVLGDLTVPPSYYV